jgi:hypothetical protein
MEDDKGRHQLWSDLTDRYIAAREGARPRLVTGQPCFYFRIDPRRLVRAVYESGGAPEREPLLYTERVEESFGPIAERHGMTVYVEPYGGPKTGGPIPDQQYIVGLAGVALEWVGHIVDLAALYVVLRELREKAREVTGNDVLISDGFAIVVASDAVYAATGDEDLVLSFATNAATYTPDRGDFDPISDGWMIGFRGPDKLYVAHVNSKGHVALVDHPIPVSWPREGADD